MSKHYNTLMVGMLFLFAAIVSLPTTASAAVFDFVAMADKTTSIVAHRFGEKGFATLDVTVGGINLKATGDATVGGATGNDDDAAQFAYLDKGNAGLGVCKDLTGSLQCSPSYDDNVTASEVLTLSFDQQVQIDDITFKDANHNLVKLNLAGAQLDLGVDLAPAIAMSLNVDDWDLFNGLTGKVFDFYNDNTEFYISAVTVSAVPLPPAIFLFGAALAGLGWLRHHHRRAA